MTQSESVQQFQPATDQLIRHLAQSVQDVREHHHPKHDDLYCLNLVAFMGERMGSVLRRLADAEAKLARPVDRGMQLRTEMEARYTPPLPPATLLAQFRHELTTQAPRAAVYVHADGHRWDLAGSLGADCWTDSRGFLRSTRELISAHDAVMFFGADDQLISEVSR